MSKEVTREDLIKAKEELQAAMQGNPAMICAAVARIVGEPVDPLKPYPELVELVCETETTDVGEDLYKFDVDEDAKEVFYINANGSVTNEQVTPNTPVQITFVDISTPQKWVAFSDLLTAKYDVIARKKKTLTRALNANELKKVVMVHDAAIPVANRVTLASSETKFKISHLWDMIEKVENYGGNFVLVAGAQIVNDIRRWDYDENKYNSVKAMLDDLNVQIVRVFGRVSIGNQTTSPYNQSAVAKDIINTNKAILVALDTEAGKPAVFSRRMLNSIQYLQGEKDEAMQRVTLVNPAIMPIGSDQKLSVGILGFESIALAIRNVYGLAGFYRDTSWVAEN